MAGYHASGGIRDAIARTAEHAYAALGTGEEEVARQAFSPDDRSHPALIATLTGPSGHVFSAAFGPGGRALAAADSAGLVWLWDTRAGTAARAVCATAGQPLARAEWRAYVPGLPYAPPCR